jgi:hypothetical protein
MIKIQKVIGITGKAGSGKDSIADFLIAKFGFFKMSLADPIKKIVKEAFCFSDEEINDRRLRELARYDLPPTFSSENFGRYWSIRKLLQFIGTDFFRNKINEDIWVEKLHDKILYQGDYPEIFNEKIHNLFVIPDFRFQNEIDYMKEIFSDKFKVLKVTRPGISDNVGIANHASENQELTFDIHIENDGTLEDLYKKVQNLDEI